MRIVSLVPSATEILLTLGLGDELVGVSDRCEVPLEGGEVPVVRWAGEVAVDALVAAEPDLIVAPLPATRPRRGHASRGGEPPDARPPDARPPEAGQPGGLSPDRRQAGEPSAAGPVTRLPDTAARLDAALASALARLGGEVTLLRLGPTSIEGILNAIQTLGAMTEAEDAAMFVVEGLRERLQAVEEIVVGRRDHGFQPPRVAVVADLDPPLTCGLWVPEQVRLAGGWEVLGGEGEPPVTTSWAAVREVDPEILVLTSPGLDLPATAASARNARRPDGWEDLRAVRDRRVFAVDGAACFERAGPRVIDGIEVLTELIDPVAFDGMAPPESWQRVG